jgi:excisionase family DNA binding protein
MKIMNITFETMPAAMQELSKKIDQLISLQAMPKEDPDKLMTLSELREHLPEKPARQTIYQMVYDRRIPYLKSGKYLYFRKSEIDKWMNTGRPRKSAMK